MPSLTQDTLLELKDDFSNYPMFIETGTLTGQTIFEMEPLFRTLYTIELSEQYYLNTSAEYTGDKIIFLHGDSTKQLVELCPYINDKVIFFLDAHWSSGDTAQGDVDVPLLSEIQTINDLFDHDAIIIIDDFRLFETYIYEDWSNIVKSSIEKILGERISKSYHLPSSLSPDDRYVIHINAK